MDPLKQLADICAVNWESVEEIDRKLESFLKKKTDHRCRLLYAIDLQGLQRSSNISDVGIDDTIVGQNLSQRPYLKNLEEADYSSLMLSDVYIDKKPENPVSLLCSMSNTKGKLSDLSLQTSA